MSMKLSAVYILDSTNGRHKRNIVYKKHEATGIAIIIIVDAWSRRLW